MNVEGARSKLIYFSLGMLLLQGLFLILAPIFHYPLQEDERARIMQIIGPVFVGYLGLATQYATSNPARSSKKQVPHLGQIVYGSITVYSLLVAAAFAAFGLSNQAGATVGEGISVGSLCWWLTFLVAFLAAAPGVIARTVFAQAEKVETRAA